MANDFSKFFGKLESHQKSIAGVREKYGKFFPPPELCMRS